MIGKQAEAVLNRAIQSAVDRGQEYFTLEHVLLSLLEDRAVARVLVACGVDVPELKKELSEIIDRDVPKAVPPGPDVKPEHPIATLSIQRLIQRALFHIQSAGKDEIMPIDLLIALFQSKDSQALYVLEKRGVERLKLLEIVSHGPEAENPEGSAEGVGAAGASSSSEASQDPLDTYGQNLNRLAREGRIDPLVGRQLELDRMIQTLCRRRKNNPLLVGEAGVGKTALAEGLALRIVQGQVPSILKDSEVYALELGSLLAGAKFRGDFEQRLKRVLTSLAKKKERGREPILFIDEIHTIVGAGAVSGGTLDASNILKPYLARGDIRCIGSTTFQEYRSHFEKDHALARRFQKIDVNEPSQEETIQILRGLKASFEKHHGVTYSDEALRAAVELASKHITDRFLPDKAIDVIDEVGARARLRRKEGDESTLVIDVDQIEEAIALIARVPPRSVSRSQQDRLRTLDADLKMTIFGQDHAIAALVTAIRLARSGLRSGERPVGSFLLCGPTGVGKTELSKQLAHALGIPFQRFDMSEYGEKHTVSRLIGAPPGYVGFEQAGLLTEAATKHPHSVVLLDEVEKAHPDVWNILLQVMDHGFLTDNNGKKADFRNIILLMTSNVGSREMERRALGFGADQQPAAGRAHKAVERTFSPEFRNRLDAIVYFNSLDPVTIGEVVGKQLLELESLLLARQVEISIDSDVREWLARKGYDPMLGARPLSRLIQDRLKKPLAEELLFGKLEHGGVVRVSLKDDEPVFEFEENARSTAPENTSSTV